MPRLTTALAVASEIFCFGLAELYSANFFRILEVVASVKRIDDALLRLDAEYLAFVLEPLIRSDLGAGVEESLFRLITPKR
jgi:hypothetical protein